MQGTCGKVFRDNVDMGVVLEGVKQLKHVGDLTTADLPQDLYLCVGLIQMGEYLLNIGFGDNFYRNLAPGVSVPAQYDSAEGARGEYLGMNILIDRF